MLDVFSGNLTGASLSFIKIIHIFMGKESHFIPPTHVTGQSQTQNEECELNQVQRNNN